MRLQVLQYAQRKLEVKKRLEAASAQETSKAPETGMAPKPKANLQPETAKAKPVATPKPKAANPQSIELNNNKTVGTAPPPPAPPKPAKPSYIEEAQSLPKTKVEWAETTYNFGTETTGKTIKHTYKFKNVGDQPLKLTRVKASCGCTTPNYSKAEIAPGEEGFIDVSFNSSGKNGPQTKTITVTGNFEPMNMVLRLRGTLQKPGSNE